MTITRRSGLRLVAFKRGSIAMKMKAYASFDEYLKDQSPRNQAIIRAYVRHTKVRAASGFDEQAFGALLRQAARRAS